MSIMPRQVMLGDSSVSRDLARPLLSLGHRWLAASAPSLSTQRTPFASSQIGTGCRDGQGVQGLRARYSREEETMRYDVIIVGAGSAGSALATRLSEDPRRSVLLLEAGPDYPELDRLPEDLKWGGNALKSAFGAHTWGYMAIASSHQSEPVPLPRGKATGGTSAINGQFLLRGVPEDYDNWAAWDNEEWAFSKVLPYFRKLETDRDFHGDCHGSDGPIPVRRLQKDEMLPHAQAFYEACLAEGFPECPDQNDPKSTGIGPAPLNNRDGVRISTALAYLDQARHRLNLTIRANVTVRRILFAGKRAVGVEVESGGEIVTVEGEHIVLSAGAIASPHLLLLSGVGPAAQLQGLGIDVVYDLPGVGRNLRDHPYVFLMFRERGPVPDYFRQPAVQAILRCTAKGSSARNDMQVGPFSVDSAYLSANTPIGKGENCFGILANMQHPVSTGELQLTSKEPHIQPAIDYHYLSDPWDRERLREAVRLALRLSQHPAFKDIISEQVSLTDADLASHAALDSWLFRSIGMAGFHSAGTCKMGPASDPLAVVDQFCRVQGLEGLRVVDAAVMPDVIRANTNATTIMIAERVADWMKEGR
jgi:choline dehydrogenase